MKRKRLLATLLAVSCVASMSVSAYAVDKPEGVDDTLWGLVESDGDLKTDPGSVSMDVETEVQKPAMAVVLPSTVKVFINPYRAEVSIDGGTDEEIITVDDNTKSIDTVVSPELTVKNASTCAVKIGVSGAFVTYKYVTDQPTTKIEPKDDGATEDENIQFLKTETVIGNVDMSALYTNGTNYYVKEASGDTPVYRQVSVKYTAAAAANGTKAATPAKYEFNGYIATTSIKVATAAVKEDTEKSNSIFMYVEGKLADAKYPTAYSKLAAGVDAKGNVVYGGQVALDSKGTATGDVLYLGAPTTGATDTVNGKIRVTGSAATNPTVDWSTAQNTEGFEAPFAFAIKPVANAAENPIISAIAGTTGVNVTTAYAAGTFKYAVKLDSTASSPKINVTVPADTKIIATPVAGATLTNTNGGAITKAAVATTGAITLTLNASGVNNAKSTFTFDVESTHGKINTYTIEVTLVVVTP